QGTQQTGYATVIIASRGQVLGIQSVPTGPENPVPWILFFGFVGSIIFHFAFVEKKLKILNPSVPFARLATAGGSAIAGVRGEYRPDRVAKELEAKLAAIRMEETWWPDDV
ncbi:MAG TPA: hypothetical protein VNG29_03675, partial [Candidatus Paceibacterota bacterium]|nr:hypothetical protein [Candidatus Paceibacterota bacterium]